MNEAGNKMIWEGFRKGSGYVAAGISMDNKMGEDTMYLCTQSGVKEYYASGKSTPKPSSADSDLKILKRESKDGSQYCSFESGVSFTAGSGRKKRSLEVNIEEKKYYILVAQGVGQMSYHGPDKTFTGEAAYLSQVKIQGAGSNLLLKLHGVCMIAAWIGCVGTGILFARYYKTTWKGRKMAGLDRWFVAHRTLMILGVILTIVGFILAAVYVGGWKYTNQDIRKNPHPVIGLITLILALLQQIMALFRPHPGTSYRPIFNWAHWAVGSIAFSLGMTSIIMASNLSAIKIEAMGYVVACVIYIVMYVLAHFILTANTIWAKTKAKTEVHPLTEKGRDIVEVEKDLPGAGFRKSVAAFFAVFSLVIFIALVALIFKE